VNAGLGQVCPRSGSRSPLLTGESYNSSICARPPSFGVVAISCLRRGFFPRFYSGAQRVKAVHQLLEFGLLFFRKQLFHLVRPVFLPGATLPSVRAPHLLVSETSPLDLGARKSSAPYKCNHLQSRMVNTIASGGRSVACGTTRNWVAYLSLCAPKQMYR